MRVAATMLLLLGACATRAGDLIATVGSPDAGAVVDAVVAAFPLDAPLPPPDPVPPTGEIEQVDKRFVPHVLPVRVGTRVAFPNHDVVFHHVYSFSPAKTFELPLYEGTPPNPIAFDVEGVVTLGCNIHDWMVAYVYVTASPWFAATGDDGVAAIGGLPPGRYRVTVWHPRMQVEESATAREVAIPAEGSIDERWTIGLKSDLRPRRAPLPGLDRY